MFLKKCLRMFTRKCFLIIYTEINLPTGYAGSWIFQVCKAKIKSTEDDSASP